MTWSYSGDPSASNVDEIRFWAQLTDTNDQHLTNEEITFVRTIESSNVAAAARCCEILATKYAREADIRAGSDGELSIKFSQISEQFMARAKDLRSSAVAYASPWAASISITEKQDQEDNTDRVGPAFERNQFDDNTSDVGLVQDWNNDGAK